MFHDGLARLLAVVGVFLLPATGSVAQVPTFESSDAHHDRLLNDLFRRHLRIDVSDTSLKQGPGAVVPTYGTCTLWRDWEVDELLWFDASSKTFPSEDRAAGLAWLLSSIPVDRFGYVFTAHDSPEPPMMGPLVLFGMGWPFPEYPHALGSRAAGWEWNGADTQGWTASRVDEQTVGGGVWKVKSSQARAELTSPPFHAEWLHAPFVMVDVAYDGIDAAAPRRERAFVLSWTTEGKPDFAPERSVRSDTWPVVPVDDLKPGFSRRVWLPMYLHPGWRGQVITRVRIQPLDSGERAREVSLRLNSIRLDYDTRHAVNNPIYVRACCRKFMWDGDETWLRAELPRMRRATEFMLTHLRARRLGLPDQAFLVGHDGMGWKSATERRLGQGLGTNYFDVTPMGPQDLQSATGYYLALGEMARIEAYVAAHPAANSPRPTLSAPDGTGKVTYRETAETLRALLEPARKAIRRALWNPATGRYAGWRSADGRLHDYGYTHLNLEALAAGIPDASAARLILSWLDGARSVAGDTSTGADIYRWEFAARLTTRRNLLDYGWVYGRAALPGEAADEFGQTVASIGIPFGGQVQDGGATLFTTHFDVKARLRYGDVRGAWRVWQRMLAHHAAVLAGGGKGKRFYRDYYEGHPERGTLQGGGPQGALGLDEEFVESLLAPTAWATVWVGLSAPAPGLLQIEPTLPPGLSSIGLRDAVYRGNRLRVRASMGAIDLSGSSMANPSAGRLRLRFVGTHPADAAVLLDGKPVQGAISRSSGGLLFETALAAGRFTVGRTGRAALPRREVHRHAVH